MTWFTHLAPIWACILTWQGETGCILLSSTSASLETSCDANTRWFWVHLVSGNGKEEVSLYCKDLGQAYWRAWMLREEIYCYYFQGKNYPATSGSMFFQRSYIPTSLITSVTSIRVKARQHGNAGKAAFRKNLFRYLLVSFRHFPVIP